MADLLQSIVIVSEKAANLARICRQDAHLFELLVEEKGSAESNPRFVRDFKTLADVLIQETVRNEIGKRFPDLQDHIKGEESNAFTNKLGETIYVEVLETVEQTSKRLEIVLNDDGQAARVLAEEVHRDVKLNEVRCREIEPDEFSCEFEWDYKHLGIWIDPIDSTAEYISGKETIDRNGIVVSGLSCVTVLIGVYDRKTGIPLLGVINQPFVEFNKNTLRWHGRCYWGYKSITPISNLPTDSPRNIICVSTSEDENIKQKLHDRGFILVEAAGAGYKILLVINGCADAYVLSKDTTFKWDTCGPQAILKSLGGDLLKFDDAVNKCCSPVRYCENDCSENKVLGCCNYGGILAYRDQDILNKIMDVLHTG